MQKFISVVWSREFQVHLVSAHYIRWDDYHGSYVTLDSSNAMACKGKLIMSNPWNSLFIKLNDSEDPFHPTIAPNFLQSLHRKRLVFPVRRSPYEVRATAPIVLLCPISQT